MYKVGITGQLTIRHALTGDYGDESRPHSHVYRIEWIFTARGLGADGFALDISRMERARDRVVSRLDGVFLNALSFFSGIQVSVENFARFFLDELMSELESQGPVGELLSGVELKVWESDIAWASYTPDLPDPG
jgi:6-pyruvoyl-tetrahydropterin synthase